MHRAHLTEGSVALGDKVFAQIDVDRRSQIARAHTATHMVHKVLHEFLGDQATQAGSENSPSRLRFDFRHGSQIPASMMADMEARANERLQDDLHVTDEQMPIEEAKAAGAMALFGEKYGNIVRVVSIGGDWSKELCAGTHVHDTGEIGLITLLGESSVGSGVRRIEALVGPGAYASGARERAVLSQLSTLTHVRTEELPEHINSLLIRLKAADKEIAALRKEQLRASFATILNEREEIAGVSVVAADLGAVGSGDDVRSAAIELRQRMGDAAAVVALTGTANDKPIVVVATTAQARDAGVKAGALVRAAAQVLGGGGGGKDDLAQGGGSDPAQTGAAVTAVKNAIAHR